MELRVEVVRIEELIPYDNADTLEIAKVFDYTLEIAKVFDYPVVVKKGQFKVGDCAVYVPIDAVVPCEKEWEWLHGGISKHCRVQAKRLRGVFSMGLLVPVQDLFPIPPGYPIDDAILLGEDVTKDLGITKYEPPPAKMPGFKSEHGRTNPMAETDLPYVMPKFTDIENIRRWPKIFEEGEIVIMTEKLHGANFRVMHDGLRLFVGSHNFWLKPTLDDGSPAQNMYWQAARDYNLEESLRLHPGMIFYGEIYGSGVQDLTYGCAPGEKRLAFYDMLNVTTDKYFSCEDFLERAGIEIGLPIVPLSYWGPFNKAKLEEHTTGTTLILGKPSELMGHRWRLDQIREGVVVRPLKERFDTRLGRVALKSINPDYLLRKKGTETKNFVIAEQDRSTMGVAA